MESADTPTGQQPRLASLTDTRSGPVVDDLYNAPSSQFLDAEGSEWGSDSWHTARGDSMRLGSLGSSQGSGSNQNLGRLVSGQFSGSGSNLNLGRLVSGQFN